jgi:phosphate transport system permease protein
MASSAAASAAQLDRLARHDGRADRLFRWTVAAAGLFVLVALIGAAATMAWGGREAFATFGFGFVSTDNWDPGNLVFGGLAPIVGTLITAGIALLIAVPVSFGIALFLT